MFELLAALHWSIQASLVLILGSVVALLWVLAVRSGKIRFGKFEIERDVTPNVNGCSDSQDEMIRNLENRLSILYRDSCQVVRSYMHNSIGVPKQYLENNGDFILAKNLLWRGIFGKNGKHSVRTIIEDRVIHEDYLLSGEKDPDRFIQKRRAFMKGITAQIESEIQELFNREYENIYAVTTEENPTEPIITHRALVREVLADLISEFISGDLSSSVEALFFGEAA